MSNVLKFTAATTGRHPSRLPNGSNFPSRGPSIQDTFDDLDLRFEYAQAVFNTVAGQGKRARWATAEMLIVCAERRAAWARLDAYIGQAVPDGFEEPLTDAEIQEIETAAAHEEAARDAERHDGELCDWLWQEQDQRDHGSI